MPQQPVLGYKAPRRKAIVIGRLVLTTITQAQSGPFRDWSGGTTEDGKYWSGWCYALTPLTKRPTMGLVIGWIRD